MKTRLARADELDYVHNIEQVFIEDDRFSRESYRRAIKNEKVWVIEDEGGILGCAFITTREGSKTARLYSIAVASQHQGKGIGKQLLIDLIGLLTERQYDKLTLEVRKSNIVAQNLYDRLGFKLIETLPGYYYDGEDGRKYSLNLENKESKSND